MYIYISCSLTSDDLFLTTVWFISSGTSSTPPQNHPQKSHLQLLNLRFWRSTFTKKRKKSARNSISLACPNSREHLKSIHLAQSASIKSTIMYIHLVQFTCITKPQSPFKFHIQYHIHQIWILLVCNPKKPRQIRILHISRASDSGRTKALTFTLKIHGGFVGIDLLLDL